MNDKEFRERWKAYKEGKVLEPVKEKEFKVEECVEPKVGQFVKSKYNKITNNKYADCSNNALIINKSGYRESELHHSGVYGIIDDINKICYIGECKDFYDRWLGHEKIHKFNKDTVHLKILKIMNNSTKKDRCYYETLYINTYKSMGYKIMNKIQDTYTYYLIVNEGISFITDTIY